MDIKSKKYNKKKICKIVSFLLCISFFLFSCALFVCGIQSVDRSGISDYTDVLKGTSYENSYTFSNDIDDMMYLLSQMIIIRQALSAYESGMQVNGSVLQARGILDVYSYEEYYDENGQYQNLPELVTLSSDDALILENFYQEIEDIIQENGGVFYYAKYGDFVVSNDETLQDAESVNLARQKAADNPASFLYEKGNVKKTPDENYWSYYRNDYGISEFTMIIPGDETGYSGDNLIAYLGFSQEYLARENAYLEGQKEEIIRPFILALILMLFSAVFFVICIALAGKWDEENKPVLSAVDRIYTEIQLAIACCCLFGGGALFVASLYEGFQVLNSDMNGDLWLLALSFCIGIPCAALGLEMILAMIRNLKYKRFMKNAIIYKCYYPFKQMITEFLHGGSVMRRCLILGAGISIFTAFIMSVMATLVGYYYYYIDIGVLFMTALAVFLALGIGSRWIIPQVRQYEEIVKGVEEVKGGDLSYQIPVNDHTELGRLAADINNISEGFDIAVQNEMKSQRMKTELISNVSHDIKTPLTSIITYVDLLKTEGLNSERAEEYLDILQQKSFRLKKLTEDLFDAAKASSGAFTVNLEEVELLSLLNQGLGEMSAKIEGAGLTFKINAEKEKYYVVADGLLLWRVLENLLSNITKYAQENTRVYVDIGENEEHVAMTIKNISKMELNVDEEELMERFKRGDESRSTEGSGLGLAIARDLVKSQNGDFYIKIDGDLFKATVVLQRARRSRKETEA